MYAAATAPGRERLRLYRVSDRRREVLGLARAIVVPRAGLAEHLQRTVHGRAGATMAILKLGIPGRNPLVAPQEFCDRCELCRSRRCVAERPQLIARQGGGTVEGYPEDAGSVPAGFLFNGALSTYEQLGFVRDRKIGKHRWVVTRLVEPRS
jgi:hypothetical protein